MSRRSPLLNQQFITVQRGSLVAIPFLDNVSRENHWLHEIRIATFLDGIEYSPQEARAIPLAVEVGLRIQDAYLAHPDVVPAVSVLSPYFDREIGNTTLANGNDPLASNYFSGYGGVWTLPEPLFVPAGAKLYLAVRFNAEATPNLRSDVSGIEQLSFFVTFVGQRAYDDAPPAMSRVPFAAAWRTPIEVMGEAGTLQNFRSPDAELYNFTRDQVVVQRLVARNYADNLVPTFVRYSDVGGRYINKDTMPLLELHNNGAWNLGVTMEPKEFFSVEGTIDSRSVRAMVDSPFNEDNQQGALFGLVGYRDIPTHVLWGPSLVARPSLPVAPAGVQARFSPKTPMLPQARVPKKVVP